MIKELIKTFKNESKSDGMIYILIFIIPLIVNIIIGYEFSAGVINNIPMAVVDYDNTYLSRMIINEFRTNEDFEIKYYLSSTDELKDLLDDSKVRVGMIIPPAFNKDLAGLKSPNILMLYDGSHMSITSVAKSKASEILLSLKAGISVNIIKAKLGVNDETAKNIALGINFADRVMYNPSKSFKNFLNPGFGAAIVQSGIALMAAVAIRREELIKGILKRTGYYFGKLIFYWITGFISLMTNIIIQIRIFNVPFKGNYFDTVLLSALFVLALVSMCLIISVLVKNKIIATIISAVIFVPNTVMVGYTWPVMAMPLVYRKLALIYPFYYYADNLRNIFLKGSSAVSLQWFIYFILISVTLGIILLNLLKEEKHNKISEDAQNAI